MVRFTATPFLLLIALVGLPACALIGPEDADEDLAERTYPEASELELVTLSRLLTEVSAPGAYNVEAYVAAIHACPAGWNCWMTDHIHLSEQRDPPEPERETVLVAEAPKQFREGARYRFSLRVEDLAPDGAPFRLPTLLGYSRVE